VSPCAFCGQTPTGKYVRDYWGNTYCTNHADQATRCEFCERPIPNRPAGTGPKHPGELALCDVCRPTAVTSERVAKALITEVAEHLETFEIEVDCREVTVLLLSGDKLDLLRPVELQQRHYCGYTNHASMRGDDGRLKFESPNIYLLKGMPELQMRATIAHELMHVWQFQHNIMTIDEALCEGSCNYAELLLLTEISTPECKYEIKRMRQDTDPIYGAGLRRVQSFVDTNGTDAWLNLLLSTAGQRHTRELSTNE
jgi:hypothetical protein